MTSEDPGRVALRAIDVVLSKRPRKDDPCLSVATRCLCEFRDHVIERQRRLGATPRSREQLSRLNSVLSVVLGGHFPLGDVPWDELERARGWLDQLVEDMAEAPA
jgi:hypothetical protein